MKILKVLNETDRLLVTVSKYIVAAIMFCECVMLFVGVIARYVFNNSIMWIDELASYLLVLLTLFGCYVALYQNKLAAVTFIVDGLPSKLRKALRIFAHLLCIVLLVALAYYSAKLCTTRIITKTFTPILRWKKLYFYIMMPITCTMMAFHELLVVINMLICPPEEVEKGE